MYKLVMGELCLTGPLIKLNNNYLLTQLIVAPLLNFLFGISIDPYAPSITSIIQDFHVTEVVGKRTINALLFGFCLGCLLLGPMMDDYGRRKVLLGSLLSFVIVSLFASFITHSQELQLVRLFQDTFIAASSIGSHVLIFDNFSGKRYAIAILYTSFAYAVGPVVAPFLEGSTIFIWLALGFSCL